MMKPGVWTGHGGFEERLHEGVETSEEKVGKETTSMSGEVVRRTATGLWMQ